MTESVLTAAKPMCFVATTLPEEARRFYAETLGLTFVADDPYGIVFTVGDGVMLRVQKVQALSPQQFTVAGWHVEDIEAAVTELSARGVAFLSFGFPGQDARGICTFEEGAKVAWFKDPDGNTLSLAQLNR
ncbi:MAG TPA: VOC family protein [Chthonomonadaceae bacterium]|nr:VOC family protein [Chthonomonadaceae bacterium]